MSYILDALRRADAERERGNVPGLNTQPLPAPAAEPAPVRRWLPWALGGGAAVLLAAGAAWWLRPAPVVVVQAPPPPPPLVPPPPAAAPAPPPRVELPPPAPPPRATAPAVPPPLAAPPRAAPVSPPVARAPAPAASAPPAVIPYAQLAEDIRRQLPALALGGAIYSDNREARMLIVSGQLMREGDTVAPGVVLEQIQPRSAVLRWRDVRYEVGF